MKYSVVAHSAEEGGFWVDVPALPGVLLSGRVAGRVSTERERGYGTVLGSAKDEGRDAPKDAEVVYEVSVAV